MQFIVVLALVAFSQIPTAASADVCPGLPASSGLAWQLKRGPDFDVCYAHEVGSTENRFGVYLGYAPGFDVAGAARLGQGRVAGRAVVWYKDDQGGPFGRQTVFRVDKTGEWAHVWVLAKTSKELQDSLSVIENITLP